MISAVETYKHLFIFMVWDKVFILTNVYLVVDFMDTQNKLFVKLAMLSVP